MNMSYVSGFFDADGYVGYFQNGNRGETKYFSLTLQFTNTNKEVLEVIQKYLSRNNYKNTLNSWKKRNPKWRTAHSIALHGKEANRLLRKMLPHLIVKRNQAEKCIFAFENKVKEPVHARDNYDTTIRDR